MASMLDTDLTYEGATIGRVELRKLNDSSRSQYFALAADGTVLGSYCDYEYAVFVVHSQDRKSLPDHATILRA